MWLGFPDTKERTLNWIVIKNAVLYEVLFNTQQRLTECCSVG